MRARAGPSSTSPPERWQTSSGGQRCEGRKPFPLTRAGIVSVNVKIIDLARHHFAVISLAAIVLVSSFWFLLDVLGAATHANKGFGVAAFESRFDSFRQAVQPHGVYGYLSDNPPNDPSAAAEYHLTQYVLAPAIIKPDSTENLVVVNSHSKNLDWKLLHDHHLVPVQDFGNGVALARRTAQ